MTPKGSYSHSSGHDPQEMFLCSSCINTGHLPSRCHRGRDIEDRYSRWWWRWCRVPTGWWWSGKDRSASPTRIVSPAGLAPRQRVQVEEALAQ